MDAKAKYARLKSLRTCRRPTLSPTSTRRFTRITLKDNINAEILAEMKALFDQADSDGGGFLDMDEFVDAFIGVLSTNDGADEVALRKLFMRVDVNADNVLDWNEFLTYMLLEKEQTSDHNKDGQSRTVELSLLQPIISDKNAHRELITSFCRIPPGAGNLYVTSSKDGGIIAWNLKDLSVWKMLRQKSCWVTCMTFLPLTKKLAVADFSRSVRIYDCPNLYLNGCIEDLPYTPLCMTAWKQPSCRDVEFVCFGDIIGNVLVYELRSSLSERKNPDQFNHKFKWKKKIHDDMVTSLSYVEDLKCIISASTDSTLAVSDVENRSPLKRLVGHSKGVNTCGWSSFYKLVCSGGQDRKLILWNPFSQKALTSLLGHTAPIQCIAVHDLQSALISLSIDKCIKIWDIRNHACLQTVFDKERYHPHNVLSAMFFDNVQERLLCGNRRFKVWDIKDCHQTENQHHEQTIVAVLYNSLFDEVLSADVKGTICVWNLEQGTFRSKFSHTHRNAALTSITLDPNSRRLVTASEDGTCKMWNFSNGSCLKTFSIEKRIDLTDVLCLRLCGKVKVVACGWDKKITLFEDDDMNLITPFATFAGHTADIVSLDVADQLHLIASGDCDGTILIWNTDTWTVKQRLCSLQETDPSADSIIKVNFLTKSLKRVLVSLHSNGLLKAWNALNALLICTHQLTITPSAMAINRVTSQIAVGTENGLLQILEFVDNCFHVITEWCISDAEVTSLTWVESQNSLLIACSNLAIHHFSVDGFCLVSLGNHCLPAESAANRKHHKITEKDELEQSSESSISDLDTCIPTSLRRQRALF